MVTANPPRASLGEIRTTWRLVDLLDANDALDVVEEAERLAREKAKGNK